MENPLTFRAPLMTTFINTLIDDVSETPIVFEEEMLPDVLRSLSDSICPSSIMPVFFRALMAGASQDEMEFELVGHDEEEDLPIVYRYQLARTHNDGKIIYLLRLIEEENTYVD